MSRVDRKFFGACALVLTLGGCDATRRSDFIVDHIGDAVAGNKAIHIADPWPSASYDTRLPHDGGRGAGAVSAYRGGGAPAPTKPAAATQ